MLWWNLRQLNSKDAAVRAQSAQKLGASRDPRAVEPLVALLKDGDAEVRRIAAESLGTIGDRRAVAPLVALLVDVSEPVRKEADGALERIDPKWPESAGAQEAFETLLIAIGRRNPEVQRAAMWALGRIDPRWPARAVGMIGDLVEALEDANLHVADSAEAALDLIEAGWRESDSVSVTRIRFQTALRSASSPEERRRAALGLARLRDDRAVTSLIDALGDGNEDVRRTAAGSLGQIGGVRAIDALSRALERKDTNEVRHAIREALKEARQGSGD